MPSRKPESCIPAPIMPGRICRPNDPCPCGSGAKFKRCHWLGWVAGKRQQIEEMENPRWWHGLRKCLLLLWWWIIGRVK